MDGTTQAQGRIAFVIHSLKTGGSEKFLVRLVNGLQREGLRPLVILLERENQLLHELHPEIDVHVLSRRFKYDLGVSRKIRDLVYLLNIGKVFCVEPYSFFMSRFAMGVNRKVQFYLSLHNSLPIGLKKYMLDLAYLRFFSARDHAIFICEFQRQCFRDKYRFEPRLADVIYNGVDTDHFSPTSTRATVSGTMHRWRDRLGIASGEKVFLMIGRLSAEKGHRYAIAALRQVRDNHGVPAHLVLVGKGPEEERLRVQVQADGLGRYVHFEGLQQEVRHYLLHADVFVMTSVSETFSLAALEAMSMGLPCALTNIGGAAEMLGEGMGSLCKSGDVASIASSWRQVLDAGHDRGFIRNEICSRFSESKMITKYKEVLCDS